MREICALSTVLMSSRGALRGPLACQWALWTYVSGFSICVINEIRQLTKLLLYIQGVNRVNRVVSITLQGGSFPVRSHMYVWIEIKTHSFILYRVSTNTKKQFLVNIQTTYQMVQSPFVLNAIHLHSTRTSRCSRFFPL